MGLLGLGFRVLQGFGVTKEFWMIGVSRPITVLERFVLHACTGPFVLRLGL